ncbi:F-box only protein 16 isoform X4 [Vidua chalybeata]|nr:F-box only protein 16 isoform X4 [Vidua chalybeata]XP_053795397.1 F-box only protein 16 isoform X4 [Vidua chalybeata]XP_053795401.1 F-box only protein 16 isoform X4 [Vidua chalybeata]
MAFAPPKNPDGSKLRLRLSSWTPLNHQLMNDKVFEERRSLLGKWFDKWTDGQRRRILVDLLERCSLSQQKFCAKQLQARVPTEAVDFTTRLPRVLSLYIFSFLDPRSLCRCAQVSWHWKYLSELDQLWMLKCLRFGWFLNFCPTPFEQGVWKKHYIEMVRELRLSRPKTPSKDEFIVIDVQPVKSNVPERKPSVAGLGTTRGKKELPPWRSSDRNPTDTIRYNYLDNYDPIEQARQARRKGGGHTPDLSRQAAERKKRGGRGSTQLRKQILRRRIAWDERINAQGEQTPSQIKMKPSNRSMIQVQSAVIPLCRSRARPKATSPSQLGQTSPKRGPAPQGAGPELPLERRDPPGTRPSAKTTAQRSWRCHQGGQQVPVTSSV